MKYKHKIITATVALSSLVAYSCKDSFLEQAPLGALSEVSLANSTGVTGSLVNAYRTLSGANVSSWYTSPMNWVWGGVRSDEAYKGSEANDQNIVNPIERYEATADNFAIGDRWTACYDGIGMCNITLRLLKSVKEISPTDAKSMEAEARFIRGFHHFEARRIFKNVAYVDETVISSADYKALKNDTDIYPKIETDLKFAYDNLPEKQAQIGKVNKWAAAAILGKVYMYQNKFTEAKAIFDQVLTNGVTNKGEKYGLLDNFGDVFKGDLENSKESIFAVQYTVGDGSTGANSNKDAMLTNPGTSSSPIGCCGFYQPSQTLVNSFKTDANGLPLLTTYNNVDVENHESNPTDFIDKGQFDPRLDLTVGRVGLPYLDYGIAQSGWVRMLSYGGPFLPKKAILTKAEATKLLVRGGWGQPESAKNTYIMRTADLLLLAAEAEIEVGDMNKAREYVNRIRARAANPSGFVVDDAGKAAGNYVVRQYTAPWTDKAVARLATRHERLIELSMEGHRFFDLVRWGIAESTLSVYLTRESVKRTYLKDAKYVAAEDDYLPIPQSVINQSDGNIKQNR